MNIPDNDNCGVKRITVALDQKGVHVSEKTVYRAMSETGDIAQEENSS